MYLSYTLKDDPIDRFLAITFLPNGEIDLGRTAKTDFERANSLLAPTIEFVRLTTADSSFDIWKLLGWTIVSYYWLLLADFGQIVPSTYNHSIEGVPIFPQRLYPPTNNIFVNETLFEAHETYLRKTIIPVLNNLQGNVSLPEFLPLSQENRLRPFNTSFLRSYICLDRRAKGWAGGLVSVTTATYAMIAATYTIVIFIAGWFQKRKDKS